MALLRAQGGVKSVDVSDESTQNWMQEEYDMQTSDENQLDDGDEKEQRQKCVWYRVEREPGRGTNGGDVGR